MKDSRIGAMGTISVVCCLAVKWAGMAHLIGPADKPLWLLLVEERSSFLKVRPQADPIIPNKKHKCAIVIIFTTIRIIVVIL